MERVVPGVHDQLGAAPVPDEGHGLVGSGVLNHDEWQGIQTCLGLSDRELEVLRGLFDDLTEAGLAQRLCISVHTVHTHLERLYRKMGVSSRAGAVVRAFAAHREGRGPAAPTALLLSPEQPTADRPMAQ